MRVHASEAVYVCMGAEPWKGCTHVGYVHEAASLGLNMGVYARLSTHVCAGPCGLCAHMVNREAGTVLHLKMCDWPEGPQICRCPSMCSCMCISECMSKCMSSCELPRGSALT